jgi:hypothetical protein
MRKPFSATLRARFCFFEGVEGDAGGGRLFGNESGGRCGCLSLSLSLSLSHLAHHGEADQADVGLGRRRGAVAVVVVVVVVSGGRGEGESARAAPLSTKRVWRGPVKGQTPLSAVRALDSPSRRRARDRAARPARRRWRRKGGDASGCLRRGRRGSSRDARARATRSISTSTSSDSRRRGGPLLLRPRLRPRRGAALPASQALAEEHGQVSGAGGARSIDRSGVSGEREG